MAEPRHRNSNSNANPISHFVSSASLNLFSIASSLTTTTAKLISAAAQPPSPPPPLISTFSSPNSSSKICLHLALPDASPPIASPSAIKSVAPGLGPAVGISGLSSRGGGPAFVGQVFSMCDLTGTGLMAVSTRIEIPFISKRTPEWMKKMFAAVTKSDKNGPVFRFFMDLGDAVSYVKRLNIPTGVVGACRLDLAYEHFKEKPYMFQFIPNEKQVKAANKLLKKIPQSSARRSVDGVPVFTAQNLDIAIATNDGIKWYTPYFFDKGMLDNILEESVDQHFHSLIQTRHVQRRRDVIDDNVATEVVEDNGDSLREPPEVEEVLSEIGHPVIPLSVISKAAEMQLLYAVDKVLLGNRWLRKATGIQPKFPYMVDSFEKRSAASFQKAAELTSAATSSDDLRLQSSSECTSIEASQGVSEKQISRDLRLPFGGWLSNIWPTKLQEPDKQTRFDTRIDVFKNQQILNPLLPKITMVGISTGEAAQMSRANLKKTMEDLTRELEQTNSSSSSSNNNSSELRYEERDPLFVANVGDYYSSMTRAGSTSPL
ncbi:hypothetical protein Scep_006145 [Stephania cephalantha]|uniref:Tic22-like family protein n=1 Tax=Stephania cephalantha TaxID=152367 RepID=A0AAP0K7G1_9MAGN